MGYPPRQPHPHHRHRNRRTVADLISPLAKPEAGDTRTTPQRQGDAFADIIELAAGSDTLPDEGGERPHLAITMNATEFLQQIGMAEIEGGDALDAELGRRRMDQPGQPRPGLLRAPPHDPSRPVDGGDRRPAAGVHAARRTRTAMTVPSHS
ncbi:DUF222 domain-containing protein [Kutzneria buriramensis]|uniref:DUF222 domain-containing protein n=1 Tax=Kutzneria buriramensis TaxID=1045776 RepID=UPI001476B3FC